MRELRPRLGSSPAEVGDISLLNQFDIWQVCGAKIRKQIEEKLVTKTEALMSAAVTGAERSE